MSKDILFLLPPGFQANGRREFCPECAELWGVLHYYPAIKEALTISYVGIDHPRAPICEILGDGRWNAPTLIIAQPQDVADEIVIETANGAAFLGSARQIAKYFAIKYGTAMPRGTP